MAQPNYYILSHLNPLDPDTVAKALGLKKRAKESGKANRPPTDATGYDQTEQVIISRIREYRGDVRADNAKHKQALEKDIEVGRSRFLSKLNLLDAQTRYEELKADLHSGKAPYLKARSDFDTEKQVLESFKKHRRIINNPPPSGTFIDKFFLLLLFIAIEAIANTVFFSEGNELGLVGGYFIAVGISFFNVAYCYVFGLFFLKIINSAFWYRKIMGYLAWGFLLAILPVFHGLIAFYRQATFLDPSLTTTEATQTAWSNLLAFKITSLDISSIALFLLGICFGGYALWKGYTDGHPYPGYERRYKVFSEHKKVLMHEEQKFRINHINALVDVADELKNLLGSQSSGRAYLERLTRDKANNLRREDELDEELVNIANGLIARYRDLNITYRTSDPPAYFQSLYLAPDEFGPGTKGKDYEAMAGVKDVISEIGLEQEAESLVTEMKQEGEKLRAMLEYDSDG